MRIRVKILGHTNNQRYAVRRAVLAAQTALTQEYPDLLVEIAEVCERSENKKITPVIIYASLVVNDQLVCVGRFPKKDEILIGFQQTLQAEAYKPESDGQSIKRRLNMDEHCGCKNEPCDCGCECCGGDGGFERRFLTKAEQIEELESYLAELKLEVLAVEEHLADLRK